MAVVRAAIPFVLRNIPPVGTATAAAATTAAVEMRPRAFRGRGDPKQNLAFESAASRGSGRAVAILVLSLKFAGLCWHSAVLKGSHWVINGQFNHYCSEFICHT